MERSRPAGWMRWIGGTALGILVAATLLYGAIFLRWIRPAFDPVVHEAAWAFGLQERAYNFDTVVAQQIYRSGLPDRRFVSYVHRRYAVRHLISLDGDAPAHDAARERGIAVTVFNWSTRKLPPRSQLEHALRIMRTERPVWLHCAGGTDRSGYLVAIYRVRFQKWPLARAVTEMTRYWHHPDEKAMLHRQLRSLLENAQP